MNVYDIAEELRTQDNRMTSHPIFQVMEPTKMGRAIVIASFLTKRGAEEFMKNEKYNLDEDAYIYVASGYRNEEHIVIRDFLMGLESKGAANGHSKTTGELS